MPTSSDLVTNLPADFETFGQAVDSSMAELLGGTTGQILSKTSNTDMDFTWITNDQGDLTAITAGTGISVTNGTGPIPTVALNLGSANVFTAAQTATALIVTGATVPTNGMYLSAANTLAFSTNSTARLFLDSAGNVGVGGAAQAGRIMTITKQMTGSAVGYGITAQGEIASDVTSVARIFRSGVSTEAAVFTLSSLQHFFVSSFTQGAGSVVTSQTGYYSSPLTGATNNFAFSANSADATNSWNFYAAGTAANYFRGRTGVGLLLTTSAQFGVTNVQSAADVTVLTRNFAAQTANSISVQNSAASQVWGVSAAGFMQYISGNTATTVGAAGGASALPATPTGYLKIDIGGTEFKVPYYAA